MKMKRKCYADGGMVSGQKYKDRLDAAEMAAARPAAAGVAAPPVKRREPMVSPAGRVENIGGVGVLSPPTSAISAQIQQQELKNAGVLRRANGGPVRGPGGPRDDKIPAMLSNGEYVLPADTVRKVGKKNLDALRRKTHKKMP